MNELRGDAQPLPVYLGGRCGLHHAKEAEIGIVLPKGWIDRQLENGIVFSARP
jgi:hypothetical protein